MGRLKPIFNAQIDKIIELSLSYLRTKSDDSFLNDASFSHPRIFEGLNPYDRAIRGYYF
jgi:hypothetical protein